LKSKIDLSRPDILFGIIWIIPLTILIFFQLDFFEKISDKTYLLIFGNILTFFIIYGLTKKILKKKESQKKILKINIDKAEIFLKNHFKIWIFLYLITILASKGAPLLWIIMHTGKTYDEFGVPTFSGFIYMMRSFLTVLSSLLFFQTQKKKYLFVVIFFIFTAFILEANRGGGLVLLLHPLGMFFYNKPFQLKDGFKYLFYFILTMIFLGFIEQYRYMGGDNYSLTEKYFNTIGTETTNPFYLYLLPAVLYITTPLQNLNYLIISNYPYNFVPFNSLQTLFPTVIREWLFSNSQRSYGMLLTDVYNTTSFYNPLIMDFGLILTFFIVLFLQIIISIVHVKALYNKNNFYRLIYPVIFMCICLTPFNLYFTSLITLIYPIFTIYYLAYTPKKKTL
jgi:oligosaccharide repeat unit polymerase